MDLRKAMLPDSIEVSGSFYRVNTGHSFWFSFDKLLNDRSATVEDFDFLYVDEKPDDRRAGFDALYSFYYEPREVPRKGFGTADRVLDYEIDSDLIYSAILQCFGIDLYEKQYHWHKVRAMIFGLNGTKLNEIIGYRGCEPGKNKELARMKQIWALPEKMSDEDKAALERFNAQFE